MSTIPLARASLCLDCEHVMPTEAQRCPACGSEYVMPLAAWLDRTVAARAPEPTFTLLGQRLTAAEAERISRDGA